MKRFLLDHPLAKIVALALAAALWLVIRKSSETTASPFEDAPRESVQSAERPLFDFRRHGENRPARQ